MRLQEFCGEVAKAEGKKVSVSIGNVRELVRIVREKLLMGTGVDIYKEIRKM